MGSGINISARTQGQWQDDAPNLCKWCVLNFCQIDSHETPHLPSLAQLTKIHPTIFVGCHQHRTQPTGHWWPRRSPPRSPDCPPKRSSREKRKSNCWSRSLAKLCGSTRLDLSSCTRSFSLRVDDVWEQSQPFTHSLSGKQCFGVRVQKIYLLHFYSYSNKNDSQLN